MVSSAMGRIACTKWGFGIGGDAAHCRGSAPCNGNRTGKEKGFAKEEDGYSELAAFDVMLQDKNIC